MILELDVGNTRVKWRVLDAHGNVVQCGLCLNNSFPDDDFLSIPVIDRVRIASVAPEPVLRDICDCIRSQWALQCELAVTVAEQDGLKNAYSHPEQMGVDRWLAMLAAWKSAEGACLVVDCGSAITVEVVDPNGCNNGGYILPGLRLMQDSLLGNTGKIRFDRDQVVVSETRPGTSTAEAVVNASLLSAVAFVERVFQEHSELWPDCQVFLTGGDGSLLEPLLKIPCKVVPELVLDGLQYALP